MSAVESQIFTGKDSLDEFFMFLFSDSFSHIFVLVDENTKKNCYQPLQKHFPKHTVIKIKSGEKNKTIATCASIWAELTKQNADRSSLLVNMGGGVIGDVGGFAAGCYKRGIRFVNVPTTLLAMVDASVGAKTGVDFNGFKNQIGLFNEPEAVFIHTGFLKTLPQRHLEAGTAEVVKHYLVADRNAFEEFVHVVGARPGYFDYGIKNLDWDEVVEKNVALKTEIVAKDKFEKNERKALNFGHTIGHAVETYFLNKGKDILHGEAVAIGIFCESRISRDCGLLPHPAFPVIMLLLGAIFRDLPSIHKNSVPGIVKLIQQDKKNVAGKNRFTLLNSIGDYSINNQIDDTLIIDSLNHYSELWYKHK